jgi:hypothetical protein
MAPEPPDLRSTLDRFGVIVEFLKRDLEETRQQARTEFLTRREFTALEQRVDDGWRALEDHRRAFEEHKRETGTRYTPLVAFDDHRKTAVTKEEFAPIKSVVYGLVGMILLTVVGALLVLVVRGGGAG